MKGTDFHWLVGILEGEGSFGFWRSHGTNKNWRYPRIHLSMTDRDVVLRAAKLLHVRMEGPFGPNGMESKPLYKVRIGDSTAAVWWMKKLYSFMGVRRKKQIRDTLKAWKMQCRARAQSLRAWRKHWKK